MGRRFNKFRQIIESLKCQLSFSLDSFFFYLLLFNSLFSFWTTNLSDRKKVTMIMSVRPYILFEYIGIYNGEWRRFNTKFITDFKYHNRTKGTWTSCQKFKLLETQNSRRMRWANIKKIQFLLFYYYYTSVWVFVKVLITYNKFEHHN